MDVALLADSAAYLVFLPREMTISGSPHGRSTFTVIIYFLHATINPLLLHFLRNNAMLYLLDYGIQPIAIATQ
jgi:hypothetical protein